MNLSMHFALEEFTSSQTAVRKGIRNEPPPYAVDNLRRLARVLENVRAVLGGAIIITSGYRSPELNAAVGGSKESAHCRGLAADFISPRYGEPRECALAITRTDIEFDQVIWEGTWVHFGLSDWVPRREILTAHFSENGVSYSKGIA